MVRERLTGQAPPPAARKLVDLWRPFIEERAGRELDRLERLIENQRALRRRDARSARLRSKWATTALASPTRRKDEEGEQDRRRTSRRGRRGRRVRRRAAQSIEEAEVVRRGNARRRAEAAERPPPSMADDAEMGDAEKPGRAVAAAPHGQNEPRGPDYRSVHRQVRRDGRSRGSVRAGRARPAARLSRQAALAPAGRGRAARQPAAAPADGAAEPRLGVRPRGGPARSGAAAAHHHRPAACAVVQAREGHQVPRHRGDAAARQFRLDARAADHGGGDLRRHSGAHAGALRRQGRDSRLHHARLEGRAVARGLARGRQAGQSRAAQRPAPHHLQVRRRAVAAGAQKSRPDDARGAAQGEHRRRGARLGAQAPAGAHRAAHAS